MSVTMDRLTVGENASMRDVLAVIDANALGIAFVVDAEGRLTGTCTDGDIRRALLGGASVDASVSVAAQRSFTSAPVETPREAILRMLDGRVRVIPLLDVDGRPVDYAAPGRSHSVPVSEPSLGDKELDYVVECVTTGWVSSQGPFVKRFEAEFAEYLGVPEAIAVSNGTVALHLAMVSLGIGPGDEVIVPDLTFAASINAVIYCGATPVIADVARDTWTLDVGQLDHLITSRTKAIMPVHLYGQAADMDGIKAVAERHGLLVVEDAAEALGARFDGCMLGSIGDTGTFSFFGNKLITTGEGGMVVFRDPAAAARARMLRDHGMDPKQRYWHTEVGFNYRITNLQAALGVAQLERISTFVEAKRSLARRYRERLNGVPGLHFPAELPKAKSICWLFSMVVDPDEAGLSRTELAARLMLNGIETRPLFFPMHVMPPYVGFAGGHSFRNSDWLSANGISLPSAVTLAEAEVDRVCDAVEGILRTARTRRSFAAA